jgi:hypothetical protein
MTLMTLMTLTQSRVGFLVFRMRKKVESFRNSVTSVISVIGQGATVEKDALPRPCPSRHLYIFYTHLRPPQPMRIDNPQVSTNLLCDYKGYSMRHPRHWPICCHPGATFSKDLPKTSKLMSKS